MMTPRIIPPFTEESALAKVQMAEDLWNTCDPERVVLAYTEDSAWRNRAEFLKGREEIRAFLRRKWATELDYRLKKRLWGFRQNRMAVAFEYEWQTDLMELICMRSPSGHASVLGDGGCCCACRLLFIVNGCFEAADTFSDSFPEFRKLFRSEDQQGNSDDY